MHSASQRFKIWSPGNPTCNVCCIAQQCKTDACTLQKITLLLLCQRLYHYITQAAASTHSTQMILLLFTQLIFLVLRRLSSDDDCDGARLCSWVVKWWRRSVQRDVVVDDTDCTHTHTHTQTSTWRVVWQLHCHKTTLPGSLRHNAPCHCWLPENAIPEDSSDTAVSSVAHTSQNSNK